MKDKINKLRNPDFSTGKKSPGSWTFSGSSADANWSRPGPGEGVTIESDGGGTALFQQVIVCKPEQDFRVEVDITCDLTPSEESPTGEPAGLVLMVEPMTRDAKPRSAGKCQVTPGIHRSTRPLTIRAFYTAPDEVRRIRVSVGILNAFGSARILHVRMIPIIETDEVSHPLAVPPPAHAVPVKKVAKHVCVCSTTAEDRPLTGWLSEIFGKSKTTAIAPGALRAATLKADALFLPDAKMPPSIRSLAALKKLAEERTVVVSLPAFYAVTKGALSLRRVEQGDDPIHAKVNVANYATHGFALHDVFPYAWAGRTRGSMVQNQFRRTGSLKKFMRRHGFEDLLLSMCDADVTTDRPIALYKATDGGGLYVLDIEPIEAEGSTYGELTLAGHLLLNILGHPQAGLGRYYSPACTEPLMREIIREMPLRLEYFAVHDDAVPNDEVIEQVVTVGGGDEGYGLALSPKPLIVVRSGLESGDAESFYGALTWFKQFARTAPHECPYAASLASRFRFAWVTHAAKWEARQGWSTSREPAGRSLFDPLRPSSTVARILGGAKVAALIDIVSRPAGDQAAPVNRVRVVVPSGTGDYRKYSDLLPRLAGSFPLGRYFAPSVGDGESFEDCDRITWRRLDFVPEVVVDAGAFSGDAYQEVIESGGQVIRIEVPGSDSDFACTSILRTDLAATLLEHVIGLQYGLIAVNRTRSRVRFDGVPPIAPGEALILDQNELPLRAKASRAG